MAGVALGVQIGRKTAIGVRERGQLVRRNHARPPRWSGVVIAQAHPHPIRAARYRGAPFLAALRSVAGE